MPSLHHMYKYTSPSIQTYVHKVAQELMEASKCLSHQFTHLTISKLVQHFVLSY